MDNPATSADERETMVSARISGTGKGSDAKLYFSPDTAAASKCAGGVYGSQLDEILFHEMVHGLRDMQGMSNPWPTDNPGYDNDEEFLAVVATNVYISAKGSMQLRADHHGYKPLTAPLNTSKGFLGDARNLKLMNIYRLLWRPTFANLSRIVAARFNPFRELSNQLAYLGS